MNTGGFTRLVEIDGKNYWRTDTPQVTVTSCGAALEGTKGNNNE